MPIANAPMPSPPMPSSPARGEGPGARPRHRHCAIEALRPYPRWPPCDGPPRQGVIPGRSSFASHSYALRAALPSRRAGACRGAGRRHGVLHEEPDRPRRRGRARSRDRDQVWPGGDQVYLLEKGEAKSVPVSCNAGENICYGAWVAGDDRIAWGVGPDNDHPCNDCCYICAEKTTAEIRIGP